MRILSVAFIGLVELASAASPTSTIAAFQETSVGQPGPAVTNQSWDVSNSTKDRQIWPEETLLRAGGLELYPRGSELFNVTCEDCSASGKVDVSIGGFKAANGSEFTYNWLKDGYIKFTLNNFHVSYTTKISTLPGFTNSSIVIPVFDIDAKKWTLSADNSNKIEGNRIPIAYYVEMRMNQTASFTSRLSVGIPDGAYVLMNFSNPESSYAHGFSGAEVTANFDISNDQPEFMFRHGITTSWFGDDFTMNGQSLPDGPFNVIGGTFPEINSTFKRVHNVDANCNPATDGKGTDSAIRVDNTALFATYPVAQGSASYGNRNTSVNINFNVVNYDGSVDGTSHNVTIPDEGFAVPSLCYSGNTGSGTLKLTNNGGTSDGQPLARPTWSLIAAAAIPAFLLWMA